jgi:hypothetical protein
MKFALFLCLFILPLTLFAFSEPKTVYTEDRAYVTSGEIDFDLTLEEVGTVLLQFNRYSEWAFQGMQGVDKESEGLIAYFTEVEYSAESGLFYVTFDLNLIWPFGKKGNVIKFKPVQKFDREGQLRAIALVPQLGTRMVQSASVLFRLDESPGGSTISYEARVKLTPFLDFFFSLRSYKKNFEWYVFKMTDNLTQYLNRYYS